MNAEIAQKWIADLRSGKYKQGQGQLCDGKTHCCLGVLCEQAAAKEKLNDGQKCSRKLIDRQVRFDDRAGMLSPRIYSWAAMDGRNRNEAGHACWPSMRGQYSPTRDLVMDNDDGKTFAEIADIIEKHWEKM